MYWSDNAIHGTWITQALELADGLTLNQTGGRLRSLHMICDTPGFGHIHDALLTRCVQTPVRNAVWLKSGSCSTPPPPRPAGCSAPLRSFPLRPAFRVGLGRFFHDLHASSKSSSELRPPGSLEKIRTPLKGPTSCSATLGTNPSSSKSLLPVLKMFCVVFRPFV